MPTPTDILVAYGAICLTVIVIGLLVVLTVAVYDWVGGKRDRRRGTSEDREVAALEAIPFMLDWPVAPENRFEQKRWSA